MTPKLSARGRPLEVCDDGSAQAQPRRQRLLAVAVGAVIGRTALPVLATALLPIWGASGAATPSQTTVDTAIAAIDRWDLATAAERARRLPVGHGRSFIEGVLASRRGQPRLSARLLERSLPTILRERAPGTGLAFTTLCDAYIKLSRYADAERTATLALNRYAAQLSTSERAALTEAAETGRILKGVQPTSVAWTGPVRVAMKRAPVGVWTIDQQVGVSTVSWILDTGANFSVVSQHTAEMLHLRILSGSSSTGTSTSDRVDVHYAVVPELRVGGATLRDLVVLVIPDAALHVQTPRFAYQMQAILGYNAFRALGRISFDDAGVFSAGEAEATASGSLLMDGLTPVVVAGANGHDLPFHLDTGANVTALYAPYARLFTTQERYSWKSLRSSITGAGGSRAYDVLSQPEVRFKLAGEQVTIFNVTVHSDSRGDETDQVSGNIGVDLLNQFHRFAFDFDKMRYSVGRVNSSMMVPAAARVPSASSSPVAASNLSSPSFSQSTGN